MQNTIDTIMAEKEEKKHIAKYEEKVKHAENMTTHIELTHLENYAKAAKDVLKVEKDDVEQIGQSDLEKLNETDYQLKFADKLADLYRDSAKEYFSKAKKENAKKENGDEWKLDEMDEALLVKTLYGTTREELRHQVADSKENFTPKFFTDKYMPKLMENVSNTLAGAAMEHLEKEHIEDIVKYMKIDKEPYDADHDRINLQEAKQYLSLHRTGMLHPKQIQDSHKKRKKKAA
jgi:hypothetical protein